MLSWLLNSDTGDALDLLKSIYPFLAFSGLESGDQFLNFLNIIFRSSNPCLFDSFNERILRNYLRSRSRSYLDWSWSRCWRRSRRWSGSLSWLLTWHESFGLKVKTLCDWCLSGDRLSLRDSHTLVRDHELISIITCRLHVHGPALWIAQTTLNWSDLSWFVDNERSGSSDWHVERRCLGRGDMP